jgi:hypothetical protein
VIQIVVEISFNACSYDFSFCFVRYIVRGRLGHSENEVTKCSR